VDLSNGNSEPPGRTGNQVDEGRKAMATFLTVTISVTSKNRPMKDIISIEYLNRILDSISLERGGWGVYIPTLSIYWRKFAYYIVALTLLFYW
jgi:hypothetical protein